MQHRALLLFGSLLAGVSAVTAQDAVRHSAEIRGVLLSADNDSFMLRGVIMISADHTNRTSAVGKTVDADRVGTFDIKLDRPGRYFFTPEGPQAAVTYFKTVQCDGVDYSTRPLEVGIGESAINCQLLFSRDSGKITGQVLDNGKPVRAFQVIAIPEAKELRSVFGHSAFSWPTKRDGRFEVLGVVPGKYLVFAVPAHSQKSYSASDFAAQNYPSAQHVTVGPHDTVTLTLRPALLKP